MTQSTSKSLNTKPRSKRHDQQIHKPFARRTRRGASELISTILAAGLAILVIVAAITIYRSILDTYRVTNLTWQMTQMTGALQRAYANSPSYDSGSLIPVLDGGGDIPAAARRVASDGTVSIETPYGGAITFAGDGGQDLTITINDLPEGACEKFLEGFVGLAASQSDLESVSISATALTMPLTRTGVATGCVAGADNDTVMVY